MGLCLSKTASGFSKTSRIVIMTPDVCHAWLMSNLASFAVLEFVRSLSTLILDEAHTLEGVFGSNFAFLVRRLMAARNFLSKKWSAKGISFAVCRRHGHDSESRRAFETAYGCEVCLHHL